MGISSVPVPSRYRRHAEDSSLTSRVDYGGLLTKDAPLGDDAKAVLKQVIRAWKARQQPPASDGVQGTPSLVELLLRTLPDQQRPNRDDPEKVLNAILRSSAAQALGKLLQDSVDAYPTETSIRDVLLSALVLDVDPADGLNRKELAGYALRQKDNWGYSPDEIVKRFEAHLATRFGEASAKVIAFQLLSVSAPEFLVKGLPLTMLYGSHQWASFSAAVARIEARQPGGCANKTYQEIMALDDSEPVSEDEKREQQLAQMTAVIDWAIANGVIGEQKEDAYPPEDIERALNALQAHHKTLADSVTALTSPMPTRRELALEELRRVYGPENERFFERRLLADTFPGSPGRKAYSLLDIYMSGDLGKRFWISSDPDFNTVKVNLGFSKLPNIKKLFDEKFDAYPLSLKDAFSAQFKYQLSLLPLEDRRLIEYGKVTTFNLVVPASHRGPVSGDHKIQPYIKNGAILFRAELEGKTCHYLYSPAQGRIIRDAEPTGSGLQFPGSRLYFSMSRPGSSGGKEPPVAILWQTLGRSSPKKNPVNFLAFSIYPNKSLEVERRGEHPDPPATLSSQKTEMLAGSVAAYYTRGLNEAKAAAYGSTAQEREAKLKASVRAFFLGLIPFYNAVESFVNGKPAEAFFHLVLDLFGFVIPGLRGGIQGAKLGVKAGMGATLGFIKGFGAVGLKAINPLSAVFDASRGVFKLGKAGFKKLRGLDGRSGRFDIPHMGNQDGVADGIYRPFGFKGDGVPVSAVQRNGKWYAFDRATGTPYGAPLRGFVSQPRSAVGGIAIDIATNAVTSLVTSLLQTKINAISQRPDVRVPGMSPGDVQVSDTDAKKEFVDPAVQSRLQACADEVPALWKVLQEWWPAVKGADLKGAGQPHEMLDRLETELTRLEDYTSEIAQSLEIFFKPYQSPQAQGEAYPGLAQRVESIEKKMAAIGKALRQAQAQLEEATGRLT
ncbi:hypothetical protein [Pseudomonas sp. FP2309]|uniref:hypothetical protein n=1 Tax=Pseudomonas sp. FP2309 TaxID=2954091 RepID=UPI002733AC12|nr:hypothetical protein [Pseudomonas sp. FP2309]WLH67880.1 hypothetical protein PSH59_22695 [Pseudomonas sp. FP2309]